MNYGVVYAIKNFQNGKMYVGQSINWESRIYHHFYEAENGSNDCPKLYNAIRKHGHNQFYYGVIKECDSSDELNFMESYYIGKYKSTSNGYNIINGDCHSKRSEETKKKMSQCQIGKKKSESTKQKISVALSKRTGMLNSFYGKRHSNKSLNQMSLSKIGNSYGAKTYLFWHRCGIRFTITDLKNFCLIHYRFNYESMRSLVRGRRNKPYKGITFIGMDES